MRTIWVDVVLVVGALLMMAVGIVLADWRLTLAGAAAGFGAAVLARRGIPTIHAAE